MAELKGILAPYTTIFVQGKPEWILVIGSRPTRETVHEAFEATKHRHRGASKAYCKRIHSAIDAGQYKITDAI